MNTRSVRRGRATALIAALAVLLAACGGDDGESTASSAPADTPAPTDAPITTDAPPATEAPGIAPGPLTGTFSIVAADCAAGAPVSGSYFRMIQGGGTVADGPFVANADSTCADQTYSPLAPGSTGLVTGSFQPQPAEPFDAGGNGLADVIVAPTKFFGANFAVSTNETDPASGATVTAPSIVLAADGTLSGDLRAISVAWNGQQFNQGSPKPDDSRPGLTTDLTGSLDPVTGEFVIEWISQIVGGPFDGFSGVWRLEGVFTAS